MQIEILLCGRMTKPPENVCDFFFFFRPRFLIFFFSSVLTNLLLQIRPWKVGDAGEHFKRTLMFVALEKAIK